MNENVTFIGFIAFNTIGTVLKTVLVTSCDGIYIRMFLRITKKSIYNYTTRGIILYKKTKSIAYFFLFLYFTVCINVNKIVEQFCSTYSGLRITRGRLTRFSSKSIFSSGPAPYTTMN